MGVGVDLLGHQRLKAFDGDDELCLFSFQFRGVHDVSERGAYPFRNHGTLAHVGVEGGCMLTGGRLGFVFITGEAVTLDLSRRWSP